MTRAASIIPVCTVLSLATLAGTLSGCAQRRPFDDLWVDARPYRAELRAARPSPSELSAPAKHPRVQENPEGALTLHGAVALALRQNPALKAAGWGVNAAEADAMQMARPPNPRAAFSAENFVGPDADPVFQRQTLRLSQVIELAGKRTKRRALGEATRRLRAWDYEQQRLGVAADAASRYVGVVVSQQRVALAERQLALAESGYDIVDLLVRRGVVPSRDLDQSTARVALGRIALEQARQQLTEDRADLAGAWGVDQAVFDRAEGDLDAVDALPPLDELRPLLDQSPRVARWEDEIEQRRRAVELARANAVPDPSVGVGLRYFSEADDAAGVAELSIPLNVFDDNRHAVLAARMRVAQARAQQEDARSQANRDLARFHARCEAARFALSQLDQEAVPASQRAYDAALKAYDAGVTNYLDVIDAERTLLDLRNQRLDAALAYHRALIEIERLTAQPLAPARPDKP